MNHVQSNRLQAMQEREMREVVAIFQAALESWARKRVAKYQKLISTAFAGPEPGGNS